MSDPVTTSSKEARAFYEQGMAYVHSYSWIDAARSFHQALRLDPRLAMAYVGLSRALSGLNGPASAPLVRAEALAGGVTSRERQRIALRAKQVQAMADLDNPHFHQAYKEAIDGALARDPTDVELWLLRGNAEEPDAEGRGQRGTEPALSFYERALTVSPDNFAAHHYLTHTLENLGRTEEALEHGKACARLAPAVPHARHMYGHNLRRVGRVADAIAEFRKADEMESASFAADKIPLEYDWHHQHNLDLLSTSYQYLGQMRAAEAVMRRSFALASPAGMQFNKKEWPGFLLARGRGEEALAAATTLAASPAASARAIGHVMASHALLAMNRVAAAGDEAKAAIEERNGLGKGGALLGPYLETLRGEFYLRSGETARGEEILKEVQRRIRAEPGPDAWAQAIFRLEAIARAAREVGNWKLAEFTAEQMREHDPAYAGTHYALALVAENHGEGALAAREYALAQKGWRDADSDLPELAYARSKAQGGTDGTSGSR